MGSNIFHICNLVSSYLYSSCTYSFIFFHLLCEQHTHTFKKKVPCGGGKNANLEKLEPVIGYTGPGGIADDDFYYYCTAGASAYIDRLIFGDNHVQQPFLVHCMEEPSIMCPRPIDDLGILGTLAACVTTMLGVQAAITLKRVTDCDDTDTFEKRQSKVLSLFARWGMVTIYVLTFCSFSYTYTITTTTTTTGTLALVFGLTASILNGFHNWFDFTDDKDVRFAWVPIVKIIWSPSFVCAMASINLIECIVFYSLIDMPSYLYNGDTRKLKTEEEDVASKVEVGGSINSNDENKSKPVKKERYKSCCERYAPHRWRGAPFRALGRNSILFYMACLMCASWIPFLKPAFFELDEFNTWQKIASSLLAMSIWFVVAWRLDEMRWYWVVGREEFCSRT